MTRKAIDRRLLGYGLVGIIMGFTACAAPAVSPETRDRYMEFCSDFIGKDMDAVFAEMGQPDRTFTTSEGNKAYGYLILNDPETYWNVTYHEIYPPDLMEYPPDMEDAVRQGPVTGEFYASRMCTTYFETDKTRTIVKIMWKGECRAGGRE